MGAICAWQAAIEQLQADIPQRIVSSARLSQLKLTMKHQQAMSDAMRFKTQSRSKAGLIGELLSVWADAIPSDAQVRPISARSQPDPF